MKRLLLILFAGLAVAAAAYCAVYYTGTARHRELLENKRPELAWLKDEFYLSDAEFKRITELHEAYQPHCVEMCRRIDAKNSELKALLSSTNTLTPDIETKLNETAQLRAECQRSMLKHFFEVSRTMPPEQGRRYLEWVQEKTFMPRYGMTEQE